MFRFNLNFLIINNKNAIYYKFLIKNILVYQKFSKNNNLAIN